MRVVGIDPGLKGALVCLESHGPGKRPVVRVAEPVPLVGKQYDVPGMRQLLAAAEPDCVYLEQVGAFHGASSKSSFSFGMGFGLWLGLVAGLRLPMVLVTAPKWMRVMHAGIAPSESTKKRSELACGRLLPALVLKPGKRRVSHDGLADAALVALYGIRDRGHGNER